MLLWKIMNFFSFEVMGEIIEEKLDFFNIKMLNYDVI